MSDTAADRLRRALHEWELDCPYRITEISMTAAEALEFSESAPPERRYKVVGVGVEVDLNDMSAWCDGHTIRIKIR